MIVMGAGHQPLVPLRPDLPRDAQHGGAVRLPGGQRRRLGALRRPGEGAPDHRLLPGGLRARLEPAAAPPGGDALLVPGHRAVPVRGLLGRRARVAPGRGHPRGRPLRRPLRQGRADGLAAGLPELRPQPAGHHGGGRGRGHPAGRLRRARAEGRQAALRRRGPRRARELPARADALALQPVRLVEQGPRVLPQAPARRHHLRRSAARSRPPSCGRRRSCGATRRPRPSSTCSSRSTSA